MTKYNVDGIIHLAAESHVDRSIKDPFTFAHTNVIGTLTLLQAAKEYWESRPEGYEGKRFYHISTDEVYGALELTNPEGIGSPFTTKASSEHHHAYGTEFLPRRRSTTHTLLTRHRRQVQTTSSVLSRYLRYADHCNQLFQQLRALPIP